MKLAATTPHAAKAKKHAKRAMRSVDTFRTSSKGFRRVFTKHFAKCPDDVESVAHHLGQVEALLPTAREAIRLARYPGAGNRNPKRMALGLVENLSVLVNHLKSARSALERLARTHDGSPAPEHVKAKAAKTAKTARAAKPAKSAKKPSKPAKRK